MTPAVPLKRWIIQEEEERIPEAVDEVLKQAQQQYLPGMTGFHFFRQVLYNRGITTLEQAHAFLRWQDAPESNPFELKGMTEAVARLERAVCEGEAVVVYGDYDVDGITSTAVMVEALRRLGNASVSPYIPNRFEEGYGLNIEAVEKLASEGARVIVSVDCGVRSPREALRARELGVDLIVVDHHTPAEEIPCAYAVVCPRQEGCEYAEKNLAGVGLSYRVVQALLMRFPEKHIDPTQWLDLVALGTVADMVPLTGENRVLVSLGLELLRQCRRPGLLSLINVARLQAHRLKANDISFGLAPRLNAAGRMKTAEKALKLLLGEENVGILAQELENDNHERKAETLRMQEQAIILAQGVDSTEILFAFSPDFNEGVVGLSASRLVERFYRPAIVGKLDGDFVRASCRSIREFHITQALDECKALFERHGGHAMAAGFTIRTERLPELIERLRAIASREFAAQPELRPVLRADITISLDKLKPGDVRRPAYEPAAEVGLYGIPVNGKDSEAVHTPKRDFVEDLFQCLNLLEPTGQGNPEVVFVTKNLRVKKRVRMSNNQHLKLIVNMGQADIDALMFNRGHIPDADIPDKIDLAYTFDINEFNGMKSLQLMVREFRPSEGV